jgi:2-(1,2-epoxy-1,2-dihydrophenyl)acetyl-CoA isomerase
MTTETPLLFERDGAIARLTLNRPTFGNAIDVPMAKALMEAAIECDEDDAIRCVLITGAGRLFCAGGDVGAFATVGEAIPNLLKELTSYLHSAISRLARMNKPLVTAINGPAAGAGFSLAILGDVVLAAPSAHFTLAYAGIGLSPDGGATWLLPRLIGLRRAQELALTNKRSTADEAAALGLVTRVVAEGALEAEAQLVTQSIAASAVGALGRTRNLLLGSFSTTLETQMELEVRSIAEASRSAEGREGIRSFVEKRRPNFQS